MQDVQYGLRMLRKNPGFSAIAIAVLAMGIGANTAIFSVVNSVLIRPLPYPDSKRLVVLWETNSRLGVEREGPSGPNYLDWKEQSHSFTDMAVLEKGTGTLTGLGEPEQFPGARVSTNFLELLGAKPILGRTFSRAEGQGDTRCNVAVFAYDFWKRRFGADPAVIGSTVTINHELYTVIGVLAPGMWSPIRCDAFVPWPDGELRKRHRDWRDFGVIGRLKPNVTVAQAQAEMTAIAQRIAQKYPEEMGWGVTLVPFQDALVEYIRPALLMLLGAVGFVLLLACTNVANLLLVRVNGRQREIGIRAAMGAKRPRLIRQFLTESFLLAGAGGSLGFLLAIWGVDLLQRTLPRTIPLPNAATEVMVPPIAVDPHVLAFTALISLLAAIVFGLVPALQASRPNLNHLLKDSGRGGTNGPTQSRTRKLLVTAETAVAFVLLMGAGLMLKSFWNLQHVNAGIRPEHVLTFHLRLPTDTMYKTGEQQREFVAQVLNRVQSIPGIQSAGMTDIVPFSQESSRMSFRIEHRITPPHEELMADFRRASPKFFETMGIPLVRGRYFTEQDSQTSPRVAVVDESFARRYWPHDNPIGKRLILIGRAREVVGIAGPVKHYGLDKPARPVIYLPLLQVPSERLSIAVRSTSGNEAITNGVKNAVWSVDKDQPVFLVRTMDEYISISNSAPRLTLMLLSIFAAVALLLAAFGIYGVMAYTVAQRTHEFGLRIALGAKPSDVKNHVIREGFVTTATGLVAGVAASLALAPVIGWFLYGVSAIDPGVLVLTTIPLMLTALAANYIPARRATRIDPMVALRYE